MQVETAPVETRVEFVSSYYTQLNDVLRNIHKKGAIIELARLVNTGQVLAGKLVLTSLRVKIVFSLKPNLHPKTSPHTHSQFLSPTRFVNLYSSRRIIPICPLRSSVVPRLAVCLFGVFGAVLQILRFFARPIVLWTFLNTIRIDLYYMFKIMWNRIRSSFYVLLHCLVLPSKHKQLKP